MKKGEREFLLEMFLRSVEKGEMASPEVLRYMADGAKASLRGEIPWADCDGGRPSRGEKWNGNQGMLVCLQCHALAEIGVKNSRIATLEVLSGEIPATSLKNYKRTGRHLANSSGVSLAFAIDAMLKANEDLHRKSMGFNGLRASKEESLKGREIEALEQLKATALLHPDDDKEPISDRERN